jgi:hypothetical protein
MNKVVSAPEVFLDSYLEANQVVPQTDFILTLGLGRTMLHNLDLFETYQQSIPDDAHLEKVTERMHKSHKGFDAHKFTPEFVKNRYGKRYGDVSVKEAIKYRLTDLWQGERKKAIDHLRGWYAHVEFAHSFSDDVVNCISEADLPTIADRFNQTTEQLTELYDSCYDALFDDEGRKLSMAYRERLRGGLPHAHRRQPETVALIRHINAPIQGLAEAYDWKSGYQRFS